MRGRRYLASYSSGPIAARAFDPERLVAITHFVAPDAPLQVLSFEYFCCRCRARKRFAHTQLDEIFYERQQLVRRDRFTLWCATQPGALIEPLFDKLPQGLGRTGP